MALYALNQIENLLEPILQAPFTYLASKLTSAAKNYTSTIFALEITEENTNQKKLKAVAKMLPRNKFLEKKFNSERTFRNEVAFYQIIIPRLREFQKEQGLQVVINISPEFYAARFNLKTEEDPLDYDAVMLTENLSDRFNVVDAQIGVDLNQSKFILNKLAELHACGFAFQRKYPDFLKQQKIFQEYQCFDNDEGYDKLVDSILGMLKEDEVCLKNCDRLRRMLQVNVDNMTSKNHKVLLDSKFLTIVHCDFWINNIMVQMVGGEIVDARFVDYQLVELGTGTRDVILFLTTSMQMPVLERHFEELLLFYFDRFLQWLQTLHCDVHFQFEEFLQEIDFIVKHVAFLQIMIMLRVIFEDNVPETKELKNEDFLVYDQQSLKNQYKPRAYFIVHELIRRGWI